MVWLSIAYYVEKVGGFLLLLAVAPERVTCDSPLRIRWLLQAQYSDGTDFEAGSCEPYCPEISPIRFTAVEMTMTMRMAAGHLLIAGRNHYQCVLRFFAGAQNDEQGHRWLSSPFIFP